MFANITVHKNHGRFTSKILSITGGCLTMTEIEAAYKDVMGKQMPSVPSILAWLVLKLSAGARNVWVCVRSLDQLVCADCDIGSKKSREITASGLAEGILLSRKKWKLPKRFVSYRAFAHGFSIVKSIIPNDIWSNGSKWSLIERQTS